MQVMPGYSQRHCHHLTCVMKSSIQDSRLTISRLRTNRSLTSGWTERRKVSMAARDRNSPVLQEGPKVQISVTFVHREYMKELSREQNEEGAKGT